MPDEIGVPGDRRNESHHDQGGDLQDMVPVYDGIRDNGKEDSQWYRKLDMTERFGVRRGTTEGRLAMLGSQRFVTGCATYTSAYSCAMLMFSCRYDRKEKVGQQDRAQSPNRTGDDALYTHPGSVNDCSVFQPGWLEWFRGDGKASKMSRETKRAKHGGNLVREKRMNGTTSVFPPRGGRVRGPGDRRWNEREPRLGI